MLLRVGDGEEGKETIVVYIPSTPNTFKANRLLYHSTLGLRVIKKKKKRKKKKKHQTNIP